MTALLINLMIWLLCGSSVALSFFILVLYRHKPFFYRLVLRTVTGLLLVLLIGSARIENIADPESLRGVLGILAIALVLTDLVWELKIYLQHG